MKFWRKKSIFRMFVSLLLMSITRFSPAVLNTEPIAPVRERPSNNADVNQCDQLPDPPGNAYGIERRCPVEGSSSGVVKGDFNGDGFADLAIGEPLADIGSKLDAGDVVILYGSQAGVSTRNAAGIPNKALLELDRLVNKTPAAGDLFGTALAAGDFNGDMLSDLAIGIPGRTARNPINNTSNAGAGAIVIVYGAVTGLGDSATPSQYFDMERFFNENCPSAIKGFPGGCDFTLPTTDVRDHLGDALAWGDFDGNGFGDLVAGIPGYNQKTGAVWIIRGKTVEQGLDPTVYNGTTVIPNPSSIIDGTKMGDGSTGQQFGRTLTAGDFDGNGMTDLAIGAPFRTAGVVPNGACSSSCRSGAGSVAVSFHVFGAALGFGDIDQKLSEDGIFGFGTAAADDNFGSALTAGDFDGDSKLDLAIGVPFRKVGNATDAGEVIVLKGSSSGITTTGRLTITLSSLGISDETGAIFGAALGAGDFNSDGKFDLAVGIPLKDVTVSLTRQLRDAGMVAVIYGSSSGLSSALGRTPQVFDEGAISGAGAQADSHFGSRLTGWNFGRNEFINKAGGQLTIRTSDLAIGVPTRTVNGLSEAGQVDVIYGSNVAFSNGLVFGNPTIINQNLLDFGSQAGAHFGAALY